MEESRSQAETCSNAIIVSLNIFQIGTRYIELQSIQKKPPLDLFLQMMITSIQLIFALLDRLESLLSSIGAGPQLVRKGLDLREVTQSLTECARLAFVPLLQASFVLFVGDPKKKEHFAPFMVSFIFGAKTFR